jgi:hypothetical protein
MPWLSLDAEVVMVVKMHNSGCIGVKVNKNSVTKGMEVDTVLSKMWSNLQVPIDKAVDKILLTSCH